MELTVTRELHPDQLPAIHAVLDAATSHDGIAPLSEQFLRGLTNPQHHHFLLYDDTTIVGIAAYDGETAELAVTPTARRHGGATLLIDLMGHKPLWAHGNLQPAQHFARHLGYTPSRELLVMVIDGDPLTAATACITNAGPGLGSVGPAGSYANLADIQKWLCTIVMLLGRLEIFTVFMLFTPAYWRK